MKTMDHFSFFAKVTGAAKRLLVAAALVMPACGPDGSSPAEPAPSENPVTRVETTKGPVTVTLELEPGAPRLSDEPHLTLTVDAEDGVEIAMPPFGDSLGPFLVRDYSTPLPEARDGRRIQRQIYQLEPLEVGPQTIAPIPLVFVDNRAQGDGKEHKLETDPLEFEVTSMLTDQAPSLADLRPRQEALELPVKSSWPRWFLIGSAAALALVLALVLLATRRKKTAVERQLTPTELAEREFQKLHQEDPLSRGEIKTYYVELTAIVRRYIERTTGLRAPEQTTQEFLRAMRNSTAIPANDQQALHRFLESADLVKFAAHEPRPEDIEASHQSARDFVGLGGNAARGKAA